MEKAIGLISSEAYPLSTGWPFATSHSASSLEASFLRDTLKLSYEDAEQDFSKLRLESDRLLEMDDSKGQQGLRALPRRQSPWQRIRIIRL